MSAARNFAADPSTWSVSPEPRDRSKLAIVPTPKQVRGTAPFVLVCIMVLVASLLGSLMLHTLMARGSYEQSSLKRTIAAEAQLRDTLTTQLDAEASPAHLAKRAKKLGMNAQAAPLLMRLSDNSIIGLDN